MKAYKRATRVAELIQENMAKIFRDIKELNKGLVTVTSVRLTDDLQTCRIFYSVIGTESDKESTKKVLEEKTKQIRFALAQSMELRRTPTIDFKYDDSGERAKKVFEILDKIKHEKDITTK